MEGCGCDALNTCLCGLGSNSLKDRFENLSIKAQPETCQVTRIIPYVNSGTNDNRDFGWNGVSQIRLIENATWGSAQVTNLSGMVNEDSLAYHQDAQNVSDGSMLGHAGLEAANFGVGQISGVSGGIGTTAGEINRNTIAGRAHDGYSQSNFFGRNANNAGSLAFSGRAHRGYSQPIFFDHNANDAGTLAPGGMSQPFGEINQISQNYQGFSTEYNHAIRGYSHGDGFDIVNSDRCLDGMGAGVEGGVPVFSAEEFEMDGDLNENGQG